MATLLLKVQGNRSLNRTIFEPSLNIYDSKLVHRKRGLFKINETSIPYNHIAEVNVIQGIFFGEITIFTTSKKEINIRWVPKSKARKAKEIIDHKVYEFHHKKPNPSDISPITSLNTNSVNNYEKSIARLDELLGQNKITKHEYAQRRKELLKKI